MSGALFGRLVMATGIALLGMMTTACGRTDTWHQKLTVEVETPHGVVSNSSVVEVSCRWFGETETGLANGIGVKNTTRGEAVVVEVVPGKYMFALLQEEPIAFQVFFPGQAPRDVSTQLTRLRETREVPSKLYPVLVSFADINDPASIYLLEAADLQKSFGPGHRLKSIRISIGRFHNTFGILEMFIESWKKSSVRFGSGIKRKASDPLYRMSMESFSGS